MKSAFDLWLKETMSRPIRWLVNADRRDYGLILEYIRTQRRKVTPKPKRGRA